ncbi:MAG: hypothetical protein ABIU55_04660 [Ferruginibacter sp.]
MGENINDDTLDNPIDHQPENLSEEIISATDKHPINPNQETENMEVHHHTHPGHHKKKWTDYFWEFLMLFLAVFCGFLAEYQLEHKIESDRVEKYMHDMVENSKYDTTRIAVNLPSNREIRKDLDSFRYEIRNAINGQANTNRLYYFSLKINDFNQVAFNNSAITQLKNSGQLRLVKNDSLLNEILDYYERKVYAAGIYQQNLQKAFEVFTASTNKIFSTTPFDFMATISDSTYSQQLEDNYKQNIASVLSATPQELLNGDKASLEQLHTAVSNFEWSLINYDKFLNYSWQGAEKLMVHIEEVY